MQGSRSIITGALVVVALVFASLASSHAFSDREGYGGPELTNRMASKFDWYSLGETYVEGVQYSTVQKIESETTEFVAIGISPSTGRWFMKTHMTNYMILPDIGGGVPGVIITLPYRDQMDNGSRCYVVRNYTLENYRQDFFTIRENKDFYELGPKIPTDCSYLNGNQTAVKACRKANRQRWNQCLGSQRECFHKLRCFNGLAKDVTSGCTSMDITVFINEDGVMEQMLADQWFPDMDPLTGGALMTIPDDTLVPSALIFNSTRPIQESDFELGDRFAACAPYIANPNHLPPPGDYNAEIYGGNGWCNAGANIRVPYYI